MPTSRNGPDSSADSSGDCPHRSAGTAAGRLSRTGNRAGGRVRPAPRPAKAAARAASPRAYGSPVCPRNAGRAVSSGNALSHRPAPARAAGGGVSGRAGLWNLAAAWGVFLI